MRIAQLADLHLDLSKSVPNWKIENQINALANAEIKLEDINPDLIVICGDIFNKHNPDEVTKLEFLRFTFALADIGNVVYLTGNHDSASKDGKMNALSSVSEALIHYEDSYPPPVMPVHKMEAIHLRGYNIVFIPWMEDSLLAKEIKLAKEEHCPNTVLFTHTCLYSAVSASGKDMEGLMPTVFEGITFVGLGDIHKRQDIYAGDTRIHYCGSLFPQDFGERKNKAGFTLIDTDQDDWCSFVEIKAVKYKQMNVSLKAFNRLMKPANKSLQKEKFKKLKGCVLKLVIDCKGDSITGVDLDALVKIGKRFGIIDIGHPHFENRQNKETQRVKGSGSAKNAPTQMTTLVNQDKTLSEKRKKVVEKVGYSIYTKEANQ